MLGESHLVTLVGPGGIGKTRLSVEAAARSLSDFPGGVWLVELAAATPAPESVARAAAAALGVQEPPDGDLAGAICREVGAGRVLVVLDNCEHVVDAAAALAGRLLLSCPNVRIVASSREPLGIAGERVWPVTTLSAPDPGALPSLGELGAFDAIRLFADRARTVQPSFELTEQNAPAVARLCSRLDGIPLAIEIAAARSRAMGVEDLVARLDDRLGLLVDPGRSRPPRHRTLRSAIEWSYDLLPEDERALFRRLSVFAGGWALDAAEAAFGPGALDPLEGLVAKSLVVADTSRGRARYSMYETVREYARERLEASGEAEEALDRHEAWTVALVDEYDASALTPRQNEMRARLRLELDNVRAVLARTAASPARGATLVRLGAALGRFWESAGLLTEGREWLARAAARDEATVDGSKVLFWSGVLAIDQGDYQAAASALDVALALSRALDDRPSIARTLRAIGFLGLRRDDEGLAVPALEEAIELYREIGDRTGQAAASHVLASFALVKPDLDLAERLLLEIQELHVELGDRRSLAIDLYTLAEVAVGRGDFERARQVAAEALRIAEELDDTQTTAYALHASAGVACDGGEPERALAEFRRALELDRRLGDEAAAVFALEGVASALAGLGRADAALRLAGAAAAVRAAKGYPLSTVEAATLARRLDPAFAAVADPDSLLAEGRRMGLDAAVAAALDAR
jgi:non-specific serine/threonine protein kinase